MDKDQIKSNQVQQNEIMHYNRLNGIKQTYQFQLKANQNHIFWIITALILTQQLIKQNIGDTIASNPPILSSDIIRYIMRFLQFQLFFIYLKGNGLSGEKEIKGLIQLCGKQDIQLENNDEVQHINCIKNLELFNNVMECEKNQSYDLFLKDFQETQFNLIKALNLEFHILSEKPCRLHALKIISKYIDGLRKIYSQQDIRFFQKRKILVNIIVRRLWEYFNNVFSFNINQIFKNKVFDEIENFLTDKKLTIKRVQSSSLLSSVIRDNQSGYPNRFTQSNHLSFSYLDSEIQDQPRRKLSSVKDAIDDQFISWKTVYNLPEKQIILQHAFPVENYIKMSVIVPLTAAECLDIIVQQRSKWDTLLMECYALQNLNGSTSPVKSSMLKKETYSAQSLHDYVCETYRWNANNRIYFYSERITEFDRKQKKIYIYRTSFDPDLSVIENNQNVSNKNIGKWECLVQIKQFDNNLNSQNQSNSQISPLKEKLQVFNFNPNAVTKVGRFLSGKDLFNHSSEHLSKSNSSDDLNKLVDTSNHALHHNEQIQEEDDECMLEDGINTESHKGQKNNSKNRLNFSTEGQRLGGSLNTSNQKQNQFSDGQETSLNAYNQQNNFLFLDKNNLIQINKSDQKQKEIQERDSENDDSELFNQLHQSIQKKKQNQTLSGNIDQIDEKVQNDKQRQYYSSFERKMSASSSSYSQQEEKKSKYEANSQRSDSGCSINLISSVKDNLKKESDDYNNNQLEDSILIDSESNQVISPPSKINNQQNDSVNSQITFFFSLLNSEAVHFFSKFIIEGDDDTMIQSLIKLQEIAKKIRKESSSTSDSKLGERKESKDSAISNNSENMICL